MHCLELWDDGLEFCFRLLYVIVLTSNVYDARMCVCVCAYACVCVYECVCACVCVCVSVCVFCSFALFSTIKHL